MTDVEGGGAGPKGAGIDLATLVGMGGDSAPGVSSAASAATKAGMAGIPAGAIAVLTQQRDSFPPSKMAMRPYRELGDEMKHRTGIAGGRSTFSAPTDQFAERHKANASLHIPDNFKQLAS